MIALLDRDELVFLGRALGVIVIADEADGAVDSIRSAKSEIDVVEVTWRTLSKLGCQADRRFRTQPEVPGRIGELTKLAGCSLHDAVLTVSGIDAPKAGEAIHQGVPGGIRH